MVNAVIQHPDIPPNFYKSLVESSTDAIISIDLNGIITSANVAAESLYGYSREELLGMPFLNLVPEGQRSIELEYLKQSKVGIPLSRFDTFRLRKNGTIVPVGISISPIKDNNNQVVGSARVARDITERKQLELSLTESQNRFRVLFDANPDACLVIHKGEILAANSAALKLFSAPDLQTMLRSKPWHISPRVQSDGETSKEKAKRLLAIVADEGLGRFEWTHMRFNGEVFDAEVTLCPMKIDGIDCNYSVVRDISQRKATERLLISTRERLREFSSNANEWYWEMDSSLKFSYFSENFENLYGVPRDRLLGKSRLEFLHNDQLNDPGYLTTHAEALEEHLPFKEFEYFVHDHNGRIQCISISGQPVFEHDGQFLGYRGTGRMVTDRKHLENRLIQSESLFNSLISLSPNPMVMADERGHILQVNSAFTDLIGYSENELLNQPIEMLMPEDYSQSHAHFSEGYAKGEVKLPSNSGRGITRLKHRDQHQIPITVSFSELNMQGQRRVLCTILNMTALIETQNRLQEAKERAERADAAKSLFLANMSHEIRTPLNVIVGLSRVIDTNNLNEEQRADIHSIKSTASSLGLLINDVLDFSKIEAGQMHLEAHTFDYKNVLASVNHMFNKQALKKGISLTCLPVPPILESELIGDSSKLKQIFNNLISNAIKFTHTGGIEVITEAETVPDDKNLLLLHVIIKDTGIGMSEDQIAKVFIPFHQADDSTTRKYGGTGLGMSIVKSFIDMMSGSIFVESQLGIGTTFKLEIPFRLHIESALAKSEENDSKIVQRTMHIMVVDDLALNLKVAERIIRKMGHKVSLMASGADAMEALQKNPADYDVVLMDMQMPDLDGCETTKQIRNKLGLSLPIVALTAGAISDEHERALSSGMNSFMTKPIDPQILRDLLATF